MAVDLSARAYAFDDLLAQVAALAETHCVHLLAFLGEIAFGNVLPVPGSPVFDPNSAGSFGVRFRNAGGRKLLDQVAALRRGNKDAKAPGPGGGGTRREAFVPRGNVKVLGGDRQAERYKAFRRGGTLNVDGCPARG